MYWRVSNVEMSRIIAHDDAGDSAFHAANDDKESIRYYRLNAIRSSSSFRHHHAQADLSLSRITRRPLLYADIFASLAFLYARTSHALAMSQCRRPAGHATTNAFISPRYPRTHSPIYHRQQLG